MKLPILSTISSVDALSDVGNADSRKYGPWEARIWASPSDGNLAPGNYPEITMNLKDVDGLAIKDRPNIGLCFSGGGSRASTAAFGIMRALMQLNGPLGPMETTPFIDRIRYTSGVSGGNWFLKPFTFCPATIGDFGSESFFGDHEAPKPVQIDDTTTVADLNAARQEEVARIRRRLLDISAGNPFPTLAGISNDALFLRGSANNSQWSRWVWDGLTSEASDIAAILGNSGDPDDLQITRADEAWSRTTCGPICEPLGLYGTHSGEDVSNKFFTWNSDTLADIISRNPQLSANDFFQVELKRPFSIMGTSAFDNPDGTLSAFLIGIEGWIFLLAENLGLPVSMFGSILSNLENYVRVRNPEYTGVLPDDWLSEPRALLNAAQLEITPQYIGSACVANDIGGGFIESFAGDRPFVRDANSVSGQETVIVRGNLPEHQNMTVVDTMGMASTALGLVDISRITTMTDQIFGTDWSNEPVAELLFGQEGLDFGTPELTHIPIQTRSQTRTLNAMDGGYLENMGIYPLLRRRVNKIFACDFRGDHTHKREKYNITNVGPPDTSGQRPTELEMDGAHIKTYKVHKTESAYYNNHYDNTADPTRDSDLKESSDDENLDLGNAVSHLFGVHKSDTDIAYWLGRYTNQVFDNTPLSGKTPYEKLQEDMQANYDRYGVAFATGTYTVIRNPNYGINLDSTPYQVEIFWYFLDSSPVWSTAIFEALKYLRENDVPLPERPGIDRSVEKKMRALKRSLNRFPNLGTVRVNVTDYEAALMGNYGEWAMRKIQNHLRDFLFN